MTDALKSEIGSEERLRDDSEQDKSWSNELLTFSSFSPGANPPEFHDVQTTPTDQFLITKSSTTILYGFNGQRRREQQVAPGQIAFMPHGASVNALFRPRPPSISINLSPCLRDRFNLESNNSALDEPRRFSADMPNVGAITALVDDFLNSGGVGGDLRAESIASLLIGDLCRAGQSTSEIKEGQTLAHEKMSILTEYIDAHLDDKLTLECLAKLVNVSPFHFTRLFKATTGLPPYQFVIRHRLNKARALLASTELPLAEISFTCGFSSQSHMTSLFKKWFGLSPLAFRKSVTA